MEFTAAEKQSIKTFAEKHVLTDMDNYTKDKGKEGKDCLLALEQIKRW